ncbi:MAG: HAMP domain-containing sensor histidine kinase [Pseudomonadota bacterium]|nr:HAMP domain-containing sensor histidine kinase [Pseudomonadota bacterium]
MTERFSLFKRVTAVFRRMGLRARIMWAMGTVSAVILSACFAGLVSGIPFVERSLLSDGLYYELQGYMHSWYGIKPVLINPDQQFYTDDEKFLAEGARGIPERYLDSPEGFSEHEGKNHAYFVYKILKGGRTYIIASEQSAFEDTEREIIRTAAGTAVLLLMLTLGVAWWLSGAVLSPVRRLADSVRRSSAAGHYEPLELIESQDEIGYLSAVCDRSIRHIYELLQRERFFSSDLSHELRTHLTVISTTAELIDAAAQNADEAQAARRILNACSAETRLLRVLLALARGDGIESADDEKITVAEAAARICAEQAEAASARGLELRTVTEGEPCQTKENASLIETVMSNLVRNAVRYTKKGGITIALIPDGFEVWDSGEGIAAEDLGKIFKPYWQGQNGSPEGHGIGLSLVKRICERRHWMLTASSTPGKGSVFAVRLTPVSECRVAEA